MLPRLPLSINDIPDFSDYVQKHSEDQSSTPAAALSSSDPIKPRTRSVFAKNAESWVPGDGLDGP